MIIGTDSIMKRLYDVMDFSDFNGQAEAMFDVCEPKRKKGTFNILRPFG